MNQQGAFLDVEADAAALDAMIGQAAIGSRRYGDGLDKYIQQKNVPSSLPPAISGVFYFLDHAY